MVSPNCGGHFFLTNHLRPPKNFTFSSTTETAQRSAPAVDGAGALGAPCARARERLRYGIIINSVQDNHRRARTRTHPRLP